MSNNELTFRRYRDGDAEPPAWDEQIFEQDTSHKCPTYVHRTPPCQGSCPSGEDIRGWLQIARGMEKPPNDIPWQEYAFERSTDANPFPAIMGRVCPAPCQDGCNRNEVEDFVGINSVEQYIGDYALENKLSFASPAIETGKKIAIVGGGVAGVAAAYQLRRKGHACTIFDDREQLGGMTRYGIPSYRTPREVIDEEIDRIIQMGVEVKLKTKIGTDVSFDQLEKDYDAILLAIGAQSGSLIPIPGADASNCVSGVAFLAAFNEGRLLHTNKKVVVIGGGDTAMDVVSVAKRLGNISNMNSNDRPENIILNQTAHDAAVVAKREGAEVQLVYRRPIEKMPAAEHEIIAAQKEGVNIVGSLMPIEVIKDENGMATALRVQKVSWDSGKMEVIENSEMDIECDLIVSAIGQKGDMNGFEEFDNGYGLINADKFYQVPNKPGYFVAGDIIRPHLLTTAIGQAAVAVESIDHYLSSQEIDTRPKVDVHHFSILEKLQEFDLDPNKFDSQDSDWGTDSANYAVHNYEDRSKHEIISSDKLYLSHFEETNRYLRSENDVNENNVLGHFEERFNGLAEIDVQDEAKRCMSCGMCFECDNCVIYCPQDAVAKTKKTEYATGRYVYTDYDRCIGCHICAEVCPTGYIDMGL